MYEAAVAEPAPLARIETIAQTIADLHFFVRGTAQEAVDEDEPRLKPEELAAAATEAFIELENPDEAGQPLRDIEQCGPTLVDALIEPTTAHAAIDTLLTLESVRRIEPELEDTLGVVAEAFDGMDPDAIRDILHGKDVLLSAKILRLICSRAEGGARNVALFSEAVRLLGVWNDAPQATPGRIEHVRVYNDLVNAVAAQAASAADTLPPQQRLIEAFAEMFGYEDYYALTQAWTDSSAKNLEAKTTWARENVTTMLELEKLQPGVCHELTDTFKTLNFARNSPAIYIDMLQQHKENPSAAYMLSIVGCYDPNRAFVGRLQKIYWELRESGMNLEEYECHSAKDVMDVGDTVKERNETYGSEVVDVAFSAHGRQLSMVMAGAPRDFMFYGHSWELKNMRAALAGKAGLLLGSCSTGSTKNGAGCIAQSMSNALGTVTTAPSKAAGATLEIRNKDEVPRLDVKYNQPRATFKLLAYARISMPLLLAAAVCLPEANVPECVGASVANIGLLALSRVRGLRDSGIKRTFTPESHDD